MLEINIAQEFTPTVSQNNYYQGGRLGSFCKKVIYDIHLFLRTVYKRESDIKPIYYNININMESNTKNKSHIRILSENNIQVRKKQLNEKLTERKLSTKNSMCDQYIMFGSGSLDDVVSGVEKKELLESKRLQMLLIELRNNGQLYDERISHYKTYIKRGGNLKETLREGEIEWFYLNKTDYVELLKIYKNEDVAQSKALTRYVAKNGNDKYTDKIIKSEMTLRLN